MDEKPPIGEAPGKKQKVREMFDAIAPRYDLLNRLLSFGIDRTWRKKAVEWLREDRPTRVLDIATGTADLAIQALDLDPEHVVGVDIAEEMLARGREKLEARGLSDRVTLRTGDAEQLPFSDDQFDAALVAFGVRNFEDLDRGLEEIRRVLRPGGAFVVLEFGQPGSFPMRQLYGFYSRHILPRVGSAVSRHGGAYEYLPSSAAVFPSGERFSDHMQKAGFSRLAWRPLTFGIAMLYKGYA